MTKNVCYKKICDKRKLVDKKNFKIKLPQKNMWQQIVCKKQLWQKNFDKKSKQKQIINLKVVFKKKNVEKKYEEKMFLAWNKLCGKKLYVK